VDPAEAEAQARRAIGIGASEEAQLYGVRRLDRENEFYYLIVFGPPRASVAVAAVNGTTGDVENWARSAGLRGHLEIGPEEARRLVPGMPEWASVELVWKPCRASRSPLYPLWEVRAGEEVRYIDQQGHVAGNAFDLV
jgi:hypothetical protein